MKEKLTKIKEWFNWVFKDDGEDEPNEKETKKATKEKTKNLYLTRKSAIEIADKDCNIKRAIYKEGKNRGKKYGIVEVYDYYSTLVMYQNRYAWYVKVMDGKYGYKEEGEYYTGKVNDKTNIRCIVTADTGEYIYIDETFNRKDIRMVTDEEYLKFINNDFK